MEYNSAMRNPPLPERPTGAVGSLDRGLQLLQFLRDYGSLRVMDAAAHLNISRSSAHRLLQTLVYRGFAMQDEEHIYRPGPAMDAGPALLAWITDFHAAPPVITFSIHIPRSLSSSARRGYLR